MKFVAMGDIHLKEWKDNEVTVMGIPKKLNEILTTFINMCDYAIENNIETVILPGDINDTKNVLSVKAFSLFRRILEEYSDLQFYIIPGNHDITSQTFAEVDIKILKKELKDQIFISAVDLLSGAPNVHIISEPFTLDNIDFIPFSASLINDINEAEGNDILISHFSLSGCKLSTGLTHEHGQLSANALKKWNLKILGDIHLPQELPGNIWYTGSPIPLTRAECNEEKRFLVVDSETLQVESVPTEGYRKYIEVLIKDDSDIELIKTKIEESRISGDKLVIKNFTKNINKEITNILTEDESVIDLYQEDSISRGINSSMDLKNQLEKYLEISNIAEEDRKLYMATINFIVS